MVCRDAIRSLRDASCWRVEVVNGAAGRRVYGLVSSDATENAESASPATRAVAPRLVEVGDVGGAQLPGVEEVAAGGDAAAVDRRQARAEGRLGVVDERRTCPVTSQ